LLSDQVCKKCGRDWGSPALDCFRKEHELVDINQPPAAATAERTNDSAESATPRETEVDPLMLQQQSSDSSYYGHEKSKYRSNFLPNITYHII
jgi:hypothetical protein